MQKEIKAVQQSGPAKAEDASIKEVVAEQPPVAKSSSEPGPSSDISAEIAALKDSNKVVEDELRKKIDEANGAVTKMKESIQGVLKKVKEEFSANKTETAAAIENLQKEVKAG